MKKIKHSKVKNTGVLFELLTRKITSDTLNGKDSKAIHILKEFFNKSELGKELKLYQALMTEKFEDEKRSEYFVNAIISARKSLNEEALVKERYELVKKIKDSFGLDNFFKTRIHHYKELAAAYKLFNYSEADNPGELVQSKFTLFEHVKTPLKEDEPNLITETLAKQDKSIRQLAYKLLIERFNNKYKGLSDGQKNLLRKYINSAANSEDLKNYLVNEASNLKAHLQTLAPKVTDGATKIKLDEVISFLDSYEKIPFATDQHVQTILRYHEISKELTEIHG